MAKTTISGVPVFIITETGVGYTDEGLQKVTEMIYDDQDAPGPAGYGLEGTTGITAFTGEYLLDPKTLIQCLKDNPTARVILSTDTKTILCPYGPDELSLILRNLESAVRNNWDSYRTLIQAIEKGGHTC